MIKSNSKPVLRIFGCVLFIALLIAFPSCKKTESTSTSESSQVQSSSLTEPEVTIAADIVEPEIEEAKIDVAIVEEPEKIASEEPVPEATEEKSENAGDASDWEPIEIELPSAMFVGTPQDIAVENLEKPLGKPRPPFLAPKGTKLVSLGKPVTSSDDDPIYGELDYITDGDKEAAEGHFVELMPFKQHVTIDLEAEYEIWAVIVWHYHLQGRVYYDVIVQVSSDPDFMDVTTIFNNDIDNSYGMGVGKDMHYTETNEGKLIEGKGVKGRYVRLHSNKNTYDDLNHYIEVSVYGKSVE